MQYDIVDKLQPYLSVSIPINPAAHLRALEALRLELAKASTEAHQKLVEKRRQALWPKDKELTELDRKTRLDGDTAVYEADALFLEKLEEIVKDRLELGKLLLQK
jgi:vacuolar-type H+-ATPase subunit E/Vma4